MEVLKNEDIFDEKVASDMDKRVMVYDEMFRLADESLKKGDGVILDATFITHLIVDTRHDPPEDWSIIGVEKA